MAALDFPDNPATGDLYGSSGTVWRWDGARWASTAGAAGARGLVAYSKITASQGSISALTDVVGLVCTWTASPERRYRLTFQTQAVANPAAMINCYITTAGGTAVQWRSHFLASNGVASQYMAASVVLTGLSGSQTYKVQVSPASGAVQITAAVANPAEFYVEDITYEAGSSGTPGSGAGKIVGYTTGQPGGSIGAVADVAGSSITFTPATGSRYELRAFACVLTSGSANVNFYITDAANNILIAPAQSATNGAAYLMLPIQYVIAPATTAALTYKLRLSASAGNVTLATPFTFSITDGGTP